MKQCERGHFFDDARYEACPYCQQAGQAAGATVAVSIGRTVPLNDAPVEAGKTVGLIRKDIGIDPAVGFLVCVGGPHKGGDWRLRAGRSFIGRASDMDIALPDDDAVSRENHAMVSYDPKNQIFLVEAGQGRGITYRNGAQVVGARELAAYDVIEVGVSRLLFLPLCGERFQWT